MVAEVFLIPFSSHELLFLGAAALGRASHVRVNLRVAGVLEVRDGIGGDQRGHGRPRQGKFEKPHLNSVGTYKCI